MTIEIALNVAVVVVVVLLTLAAVWAVRRHREIRDYFAGRRDQAAGHVDPKRGGAYVSGVTDEMLNLPVRP